MPKKQTIKCKHEFFEIEKIVKPAPNPPTYQITNEKTGVVENIPTRYSDLHGIRIACHLCGQVKTIWENGEIFIEKQ